MIHLGIKKLCSLDISQFNGDHQKGVCQMMQKKLKKYDDYGPDPE